jgi:hypothetical protein
MVCGKSQTKSEEHEKVYVESYETAKIEEEVKN